MFELAPAEEEVWHRDYLQLQSLLDDVDSSLPKFQPSPSLANLSARMDACAGDLPRPCSSDGDLPLASATPAASASASAPASASASSSLYEGDEDDRGAGRTTKPVPRLLQPGAKLGETCDSLRLTTRKRLAPDHNRPSSAAAPPPRGAAPKSPSRAELNTNSNSSNSIDLVVSGGGLKGYFLMGASLILRRQLARRGLHIARVAGASCGAWAAFFIMSGISTEIWLKTYQMSRLASVRDPHKTILEICTYLV